MSREFVVGIWKIELGLVPGLLLGMHFDVGTQELNILIGCLVVTASRS